MLMSLPSSVEIDPASANEGLFQQVLGSCDQPGNMSKRGSTGTGQFVAAETKLVKVDEHAKFGGDRTCQRKRKVFFSKWLTRGTKPDSMSNRGRTAQFVVA